MASLFTGAIDCANDSASVTGPRSPRGLPPSIAASPTDDGVLAADAFSRVVDVGWGVAEVGGDWSYNVTNLSPFQVSDGSGLVKAPNTNPLIATLEELPVLDAIGVVALSIDLAAPPSRFHKIEMYARRRESGGSGQYYYRFRVRADSKGRTDLRVEKRVSGTNTWLTSDVVTSVVWQPGVRYWIRWECSGTSPSTTLRMRVWRDGDTEPAEWQLNTVVNEPALDVSGITGFRVSPPSSSTYPIRYSFDDFKLVAPAAPNTAPTAAPGGPYTGKVGEAVVFDGSGSSDADGDLPLTYRWDFGDGGTGEGAAPSHSYASAGEYTVTLTVTDSKGLASEPATTTATVEADAPVNTAPVAAPGGPYTGRVGEAIAFDGSKSSDADGDLPLTYHWDFGDGATADVATPSHTYATAGEYTVTLTVTDSKGLAGEPATTTATVNANKAPVAAPGGPYTGRAGEAVAFDGSGSSDPDGDLPLSYRWDFGDGATSDASAPTHTYATAGTYTVTLTVTDAKGLASEPATTTATIEANKAPVAAPGGPYTGEVGKAVLFDGSGSSDPDGDLPLTYHWDFGDGATASGAAPSHAYSAAGTYTVTLTVTDSKGLAGEPATTSATISDPPPLVRDRFNRVGSNGWGSAEVGGPWRIDDAVRPAFRTDGSQGQVVAPDIGPRNAVATDGYGMNVTGVTSFSVDVRPDDPTRFHTIQVYARRNDQIAGDGDYYYRYRVRAFGSGTIDLRTEKRVSGVSAFLGTENKKTAATFAPGKKYWVRWEAVGTSPATMLRIRLWADGAAEPSAWDIELTVNEPGLDIVGTTGFRVQVATTNQVTFPVTFSFDDLEYRLKN